MVGNSRLFYVDHLRVLLTVLVIFHHTAITYGGEGSWYYIESTETELTPTKGLLSLFTGVNQAFFMGFFFLISGYFTPRSYDRKGALPFLKDRFIRLGIPLAVYVFLIGPSLIYAMKPERKEPFWSFYSNEILSFRIINWGPLWFVEALLYMAIAYVLFRMWDNRRIEVSDASQAAAFPSHRTIFLSALLIGSASFLIRLVMPTGKEILGLQLGYFASYIFLFIVGILAFHRNWFQLLPVQTARTWLIVSLCTLPALPISAVFGDVLGQPDASINGGLSWLAFIYAFWEPFVAFGIIMYLLVWFRDRFNTSVPMWQRLAASAYTVYIIHPPIVVAICYMLRGAAFPNILKFILAGLAATACCFAIASLLRKIPFADRVL